jgi:hypothetical protein
MDHLVVNERGDITDINEKKSLFEKVYSVFFSYLFHPLFLIAWVTIYLLYRNDKIFLGLKSAERMIVFLRIFGTSIFIPLVTVFLLKALGFIQTIQLKTQRERIIPYVACITFFFWSFYVSKQLNDPPEFTAFLLSLFISSIAALLINNYFKVSMHAIGAGGLTAFFILLLFADKLNDMISFVAAIVIAGIICSSRLISGNHSPFEIYFGFIAGFILQLIAWAIIV